MQKSCGRISGMTIAVNKSTGDGWADLLDDTSLRTGCSDNGNIDKSAPSTKSAPPTKVWWLR